MANRSTAHKPLQPNTTDHFKKWAGYCVLDNGRYWDPEPFQLEIIDEVFDGYREILALLPTGSYKTTTCGGLALYKCQFTISANVPIGAAAKKQAAIMYEQSAGFVRRTPGLKKRFKIQDGYKKIVCLATRSAIEVYSAKDDTGDGIIPDLAFLDELHRHKGHDLYGTWRDKLTKRQGQLVVLSTAGDDENNPVEELRDAALRLPNVTRRGRHTVARSEGPEFVMHMHALDEKDNPDDLEAVKAANPASQVTIEELRMRRDSPSTKRWQWLRFTCNVRTKGEESAIDPDALDALKDGDLHWARLLQGEFDTAEVARGAIASGRLDVTDDAAVYGWLDLGYKIDTTAMGILAWESHGRRVVTDVTVLEPPVDEADIVIGLLALQQRYGLVWIPGPDDTGEWQELERFQGVVYDPNAGGRQMAQLLEKREHPLQYDNTAREKKGLQPLPSPLPPLRFHDHAQTNAPMALAASRLDEAIRNRWFVWDGHPKVRRHFLNAVTHTLGGETWKYDRPANQLGEGRRKYPIDCLTGVLMGHSVAVGELDEPEEEPPTDLLEYRIGFV